MVYAEHLKCFGRKVVWVRVPPWAPPHREYVVLVLRWISSGLVTEVAG